MTTNHTETGTRAADGAAVLLARTAGDSSAAAAVLRQVEREGVDEMRTMLAIVVDLAGIALQQDVLYAEQHGITSLPSTLFLKAIARGAREQGEADDAAARAAETEPSAEPDDGEPDET